MLILFGTLIGFRFLWVMKIFLELCTVSLDFFPISLFDSLLQNYQTFACYCILPSIFITCNNQFNPLLMLSSFRLLCLELSYCIFAIFSILFNCLCVVSKQKFICDHFIFDCQLFSEINWLIFYLLPLLYCIFLLHACFKF